MPKGTSELSQIKEQWRDKVYEVLGAERDVKFRDYPVAIGFGEIKFLTLDGQFFFAVAPAINHRLASAYIFRFRKEDRNEKYLKACAEEMFKGVPKMLLEFAKTIIKLNEKGAKIEESAA